MGFQVPEDLVCNVVSVYLTQITQEHRFLIFSIEHSIVKLCRSTL